MLSRAGGGGAIAAQKRVNLFVSKLTPQRCENFNQTLAAGPTAALGRRRRRGCFSFEGIYFVKSIEFVKGIESLVEQFVLIVKLAALQLRVRAARPAPAYGSQGSFFCPPCS